jgi:hypothetical protein
LKIFQKSFETIYEKAFLKENKKSNFLKLFKNNDSNEMKFLTYFNKYFIYSDNIIHFTKGHARRTT